MRKKKPIPAMLDQTRRRGLTLRPQIKDHDGQGYRRGVQRCDGCAATLLEDWDRTVTEIPPGKPQY
jgi:hypothetical protein